MTTAGIQCTVRFLYSTSYHDFLVLSWTVLTSFSLLSCWSLLRDCGYIAPHTHWPLTWGKTQGIETLTYGTLQWRISVHFVIYWLKDGYPPTQWQTTSAICEDSLGNNSEYQTLPVRVKGGCKKFVLFVKFVRRETLISLTPVHSNKFSPTEQHKNHTWSVVHITVTHFISFMYVTILWCATFDLFSCIPTLWHNWKVKEPHVLVWHLNHLLNHHLLHFQSLSSNSVSDSGC